MSNKKTRLHENTVRRFMKLASIAPLTETFVEKLREDTEEELEEGGMPPAVYDREPGEEDLGTDEMPQELGMDEPGEEMPEEEPAGDALTFLMSKIKTAVDDTVEKFDGDLGRELDVEGEPEGEEELGDMGDLEGEEGVEGDMPMEPALEESEELSEKESKDENTIEEAEEEEEALEESETEDDSGEGQLSEENLLEKIAEKVSQRLAKEQKLQESRTKKVSQLTDAIVERIFSSTKK